MKLNERAYEHARRLIAEGHVVLDDRDDWSEHQPTAADENRFIEAHGIDEYARWYLGVDKEKPASSKRRYRFPYGDFRDVHRCGLLAPSPGPASTSTTTSSAPWRTCTGCSTRWRRLSRRSGAASRSRDRSHTLTDAERTLTP